ncbi:ArsR/SmtB family transcription factor [Actinokineospora cianjurensis]|uniref:Helix-turn-helix protein n=1 Tax=Actinokineospora cianjurensis TaxID=585224 RepID=A0A421B4U6_9PSEU|nr:ArsR family transcriptional regulator [Actinokineospora cianjurensis]RLK59476.1 helix-turn-helix protein [Actinokineospora cianjurensis]
MLRLLLTFDDALRIRMAPSADPLWETRLSLQALRRPVCGIHIDAWRRGINTTLSRDQLVRSALRFLTPLVPVEGYVPDFLTPTAGNRGVRAGIDAVLETPPSRVKSELAMLVRSGPVPRHVHELASGDLGTMKRLGWALGTYHDAVIAPHWGRVQALVDADRAQRARTVADQGAEQVLAGLDGVRWHPPRLEVDSPVDRVLDLGGSGLQLVPSLFCQGKPVMPVDEGLPRVLVYPIDLGTGWSWHEDKLDADQRDVRALLGSTRATILEHLVARDRFTGELARIVAMTPATVSKHTAVLRHAGLIISTQSGRHVTHRLTRLGAALLNRSSRISSPEGKRRSVPSGDVQK